MAGEALPVLEPVRLRELAGELDSRSDALDFAARFLRLLPGRIEVVVSALGAGRAEPAHVALLSLASSAGAVGALQLERDARLCDRDVRAGRLALACGYIPRLGRDATAVARALEGLLQAG